MAKSFLAFRFWFPLSIYKHVDMFLFMVPHSSIWHHANRITYSPKENPRRFGVLRRISITHTNDKMNWLERKER